MASTYKTPNMALTQFIDTDTPSWLTDYNNDMMKIDNESMSKLAYDANGDVAAAGGIAAYMANKETAKNMEVHVSVNSGNDATGDGSNAAPYRTIKKALSTIPKIIKHFVTIKLDAGDYRAEGLIVLQGFIVGADEFVDDGTGKIDTPNIRVLGADNRASSESYILDRLFIGYCACGVLVRGIKFAGYSGNNTFIAKAVGSPNLTFLYCTINHINKVSNGNTGRSLFVSQGSYAIVQECEFSNQEVAVSADYGGHINMWGCVGSGNATAMHACYSGHLTEMTEQSLTGATKYWHNGGGLIVRAAGALLG